MQAINLQPPSNDILRLMKTLLLTAYDSAMAPIGDLTAPLMLEYANRHGFGFHCARTNSVIPSSYWIKIFEIAKLLPECDRIIWLDADQVVTNPDFVPPWHSGFQASFDWGMDANDESMFSACGFVIGRDMIPLVDALMNGYEQFKGRDFPEQSLLRHLYKDGSSYKFRMRTHPRRVFNAVPREISEEAPEPWERGDWCAHLTHVPVERRVELFHEIRRQAE